MRVSEWISVVPNAGRLATLFTHTDIQSHAHSTRPSKYKLNLDKEIAAHQQRQSVPITDAARAASKRVTREITVGLNERLMLTINAVRVAAATSGVSAASAAGSSSSAARTSGSPLALLSDIVRMLSPLSPQCALVPIVLHAELLVYVKTSLPRFSIEEFDTASRNAQEVGAPNVLSAESLLRTLLGLLGASMWQPARARPPTVPNQHADNSSASASATDELQESQSFCWQR